MQSTDHLYHLCGKDDMDLEKNPLFFILQKNGAENKRLPDRVTLPIAMKYMAHDQNCFFISLYILCFQCVKTD